MVEKLLIEKQKLQKDMDKIQCEKNNVEKQLEEKNKKFEELLVENQTLKEQMNLQSAQLPLNALNSNESADKHPAKPLKKVKKFGQKPDLNRHLETVHEKQKNYKCEFCDKSFGRKENLNRHIETK